MSNRRKIDMRKLALVIGGVSGQRLPAPALARPAAKRFPRVSPDRINELLDGAELDRRDAERTALLQRSLIEELVRAASESEIKPGQRSVEALECEHDAARPDAG